MDSKWKNEKSLWDLTRGMRGREGSPLWSTMRKIRLRFFCRTFDLVPGVTAALHWALPLLLQMNFSLVVQKKTAVIEGGVASGEVTLEGL
jgi:hypothetical protein